MKIDPNDPNLDIPELSALSLARLLCLLQRFDADTTAHLALPIQDLDDRVLALEVKQRDEDYRRSHHKPFYLRWFNANNA